MKKIFALLALTFIITSSAVAAQAAKVDKAKCDQLKLLDTAGTTTMTPEDKKYLEDCKKAKL